MNLTRQHIEDVKALTDFLLTGGDRFWSKVDKNGPVPAHRPDLGPCWLWTAVQNGKGYGQFRLGGRMQLVHRLSYEWLVGHIPDGLELDHLCRVRNCVNPTHLEPVTQFENMRRGESGRNNAIKTHCPQGHEYAGENLYLNQRGERRCRTCHREANRRWYAQSTQVPVNDNETR